MVVPARRSGGSPSERHVGDLRHRCTPHNCRGGWTVVRRRRYPRPPICCCHVLATLLALSADLLHLLRFTIRSCAQLAAENLFLRKQLALYVERKVRPKRAINATRVALVLLSRLVAWQELLTIVRPDTLVR